MIQGYALTAHPNRRQTSLLSSIRSSASSTLVFSRSSHALFTRSMLSPVLFWVADTIYNSDLPGLISWTTLVSNSALAPPDIRSYSLWPLPGMIPTPFLLQVQLFRSQLRPMSLVYNQLRGRSDGNKIYPIPNVSCNGKQSRGISHYQGLVRAPAKTHLISNLRTKIKKSKDSFSDRGSKGKRERGWHAYPRKGVKKKGGT